MTMSPTTMPTNDNGCCATLIPTDQLPARAPDLMRELVRDFLGGRRQTTHKVYSQALEDFTRFLGVGRVDQAASILLSRGPGPANQSVLRYRTHLVHRGMSTATINVRLAAIRSLARLARVVGLISWALEVRNLRDEGYRDMSGPGIDGVRGLLDRAAQHSSPAHAARDVAMLRLMFDLGLRRGSVTSLDREHVDLNAGVIHVHVKGKRERVRRSLPDPTSRALQRWLEYRGAHGGPLFVSLDRRQGGGRLSGRSLHRIVKKLGADIGITARPHSLRHSSISTALDLSNGNIRAVAKFSGHANINVVERYDDCRRDLAGEIARRVAASV